MKISTRKKPAGKAAPVPANEAERLSALRHYGILDTPPEAGFDELTELAGIICKAPVATITLVDQDREWYKSRIGIIEEEAPRDISFCAHTILGKNLFIIPDTFKDKRFRDNPLVKDDPPLRFYAAAPLITDEGYALGTLCVIDHVPRKLNSDQKKALKTLAHQAMAQIELRLKNTELEENLSKCKEADAVIKINKQLKAEIETKKQIEEALEISRARLAVALESAKAGVWDWNMINNEIIWNREHEKLFGFEPGTFNGNYGQFEKRIHPDDRAGFDKTLTNSIETRNDFHHEYRIIWPDKSIHWIEGAGRFEFNESGRAVRMYGIVRDITERKLAEEQIRNSEIRFRELADNIEEVFWLQNAEEPMKILYVSPAFRKIWGFEPDKADTFKSWLETVHVDDRVRVKRAFNRMIEGEGENNIEFRINRPDGELRWIWARGFPINDEQGNTCRTAGVAQDITDRKLTENALQESKARLQNILDSMYAFVGLFSTDGILLEANRAPLERASLTRNQVIGKPFAETYWWSYSPSVQKRLRKALQDAACGETVRYDEIVRLSDDHYITIDLMIGPLYDSDGKIIQLIGSAVDITDRKHAENRLREEQRKLSTLISNMPGMVYRCKNNPDWTLEFASKNIEKLSGYFLDDFYTGRNHWGRIIHPDDAGAVWEKVQESLSTHGSYEIEYRIIHADGTERWIWEHGQGIFDQEGQLEALEGVVFDITDWKLTDQALRESEEKFYKAFHSNPNSMIINRLDDGRIIDTNKAFERIVGYSRDEAIGKTPIELSIWSQPRERGRFTQILKEKGYVRDFEVQVRRKGGETRIHRLSAETITLHNEPCIVSIGEDITEKKQTREKLLFTQFAVDHAADSIHWLTSDGSLIYVNDTACKKLGYSRKELMSMTIFDINPDYTKQVWWERWQTIKARKNLFYETRHRTKDGRIFPVEVRGNYLKYNDREYNCSIVRDISERKKTDQALRDSEEKFRSIVETTSEWIWECDLEGNIIYSNKTINELLGYDNEKLLSKNAFEFVHPDDRDNIREKFQDCIKKKTGWNGWIVRWLQKNGGYRYTESNAGPMFDQNNELIGFRGSDRDITHRRKTEEEINELRRRNELILENAGEGIYGLDTNGITTFVNPAAAKMLGWEPEELIGKRQHDLIHYKKADGSDYPVEECPIYKAFKEGHVQHVDDEFFFRKDYSCFPVEYTSTPIRNADGMVEGAVVMFRDITERKQSENSLRRSEAMLSEAQQVAHMGSWEVDHKSRQLSWSDECYRIFEVDKETFHVSYESFLESVHPDDRKQVDTAFREAVKKHSIYNINHRLLMPDGRIKYINEKCKTYYDEYGKPLRSVGTTIDYTREKLAKMELEAKARQQQFIARLGRLSLSKADLTEIFDTAISGLAEILDVDYSKILELQPDGKRFVLIAGHGWRTGMVGQTVVSADLDSQAGYTLNQNKPVVVKDLRTESRFTGPQLLLEQGIVSGVSVVIEGRDKPYGVLGVHTSSHRKFSQFDVDFVQAVAVILAEAIEHDFVSYQILSSRQRLRNLAARLQTVREEERTRISREIHDELGQSLTGLRIDLAWIHNQLEGKDDDLSERTQSALGLADSTLDSVRHISHDLRPPILDDLGLEAAIEWQIGEFRRYSHCQCDLEINAGDIGIQNKRDTVVFRILQEALTNIARHAMADKIEIKLLNHNGKLILNIVDNGIGINKTAIDSNDSIGLIGMKERAGTLGGRVDIQRGDNGGTIIRLVVPLGKHGRFDS